MLPWLRTPKAPQDCIHGWQSYVCYVDPCTAPRPRNEIMDRLKEQGVSTRPGTHAVHMLGLYRSRYGLEPSDYPNARDCEWQTLAIPLHNRMEPEDYQRVVAALLNMR
jgi:dTDP-4-amino-4,6-dideoxygalactose transaminase